MTVDLSDLRITGGPSRPVEGQVVRSLNESDLTLLNLPRREERPGLQRIRDNHHALARALSMGLSNPEAAMVTGFSESRISFLKNDPTFRELISHYHKNKESALADLHDRMAQLSMDAINILAERIETDPTSFGHSELRKIIETTADRTGFGPKTTQVNVNLDLADRLNRARQRAGLRTEGDGPCRTLDLRAEPLTLGAAPSPTELGTDGEAGESDA
jgi:hypothetical protein